MSNPLTTGKIGGRVYDLRHWKLALTVGTLFVLCRFLGGRNLRGGGRSTDATFLRGARRIHGTWWASAPGAARLGVRCGVLAVIALAVAGYTTIVAVVAACGVALMVRVGLRQLREERHLRQHVRPVWPAVAGIIGVSADESPLAWLDVPADARTNPAAEIAVGLRAADAADERRMTDLVTLFSQRYGVTMAARLSAAQRMILIRHRPPEPAIWRAVAGVLHVPAVELASDWLTVSPYVLDGSVPEDAELTERGRREAAKQRKQDATVVVSLPDDIVDDTPIAEALETLVEQRYGGDWSARTDRIERTVTLRRRPPPPMPPTFVDFWDLPGLEFERPGSNPAAAAAVVDQAVYDDQVTAPIPAGQTPDAATGNEHQAAADENQDTTAAAVDDQEASTP